METDTCPICCEDYDISEIVTLECGHVFHKMCLMNWSRKEMTLKTSPSCPLCRDEYDADKISSTSCIRFWRCFYSPCCENTSNDSE